METIKLKRGKDESLLRFHPWVFSGAIENLPSSIKEGDLVRVVTNEGKPLGIGLYEIGSIAVRILTFRTEDFDLAPLIHTRLENAFKLRGRLGLIRPEWNNTFRLVHGEGDFLPGCIVDVYGHTAVLQAHTAGIHNCRDLIANALVSLQGSEIRNVYYKSETTLPYMAHLDPISDYLIGSYEGNTALENGLKFNIDWLKGQKTGFFVDQRDNRLLLEKYASGQRVLNMFCYTGGFSVYAMRGGAELVHSVDSSAKAIALTDANVNQNFPEDSRHESFAEDAFKYLSEMGREDYNLIILDPPAFAKHRNAVANALRGYRRLNAAAIEKIAPGGILFTFSCSQAVSPEQFRLAVFTAAAQTRRRVRILHQMHQPADHPINIYHPEGEYLKGLVLYIE